MECFLYEFKTDLNAYLAAAGPEVPVHSLKEIIEFNEQNRERELHLVLARIFFVKSGGERSSHGEKNIRMHWLKIIASARTRWN